MTMTPAERKAYAQRMFAEEPAAFPGSHRPAILQGVVLPGMAPFEARLAAGAFSYKVTADPAKWPPHSNPLDVMWRQSIEPDNSEIVMTFVNNTQFPGEPTWVFRVFFDHGRATRIEELRAGS